MNTALCSAVETLDLAQQALTLVAHRNPLDAFDRLKGAIRLASGEIKVPFPALQVDLELYETLLVNCPGIVPPLPTDAVEALAAINLLQQAINAASAGQLLQTLLVDPAQRLQALHEQLDELVDTVKLVSQLGTSLGTVPIPSIADAAAKLVGAALLQRALTAGGSAAGLDPLAILNCLRNYCAGSSR